MVNEPVDIKITVITPVHIGNGEILSPYTDFVIENGRISIIDSEKLFQQLDQKLMKDYLKKLKETKNNENKYTLKKLIHDNNISISDYIISNSEFQYSNNQSEIQMHIKTDKELYIPGSSLKGALRTSMMLEIDKKINMFIKQKRREQRNNKNSKKIKEDIDLLKRLHKPNNMMKIYPYKMGIQDAYIKTSGKICYIQSLLYNISKRNEDKNYMNMFSQCIDEGCVLNSKITFYQNNDYLYNKIKKIIPIESFNINDIFKMNNNFYYNYINKEMKEIKNNKKLNILIKRYSNLLDIINQSRADNNNSSLLRIGSYKTKQNHIAYEKCDTQSFTRKFIVDDNNQITDIFGWIKLERVL